MNKFAASVFGLFGFFIFSAFAVSAQVQTTPDVNIVSPDEHSLTAPAQKSSTDEKQFQDDENKQRSDDDYTMRRGDKEFNFEIGIAPFKPSYFAGPEEYNRSMRRMGFLNFRIGRVVGTKRGVTYTYLFGFTPLIVALKNEVKNEDYVSPTVTPNVAPTKRETSYGVGFQPINFRFTFYAEKKIKPYFQAGAGIAFFNKSLPIPVSRRMQFTGDLGFGFLFHTSKNKFWTLGYKYFHLSNGNIGGKINNPGYNANTFYIGYSFLK